MKYCLILLSLIISSLFSYGQSTSQIINKCDSMIDESADLIYQENLDNATTLLFSTLEMTDTSDIPEKRKSELKTSCYIFLSQAYYNSNNTLAKDYAEKALDYSLQTNSVNLQIDSYSILLGCFQKEEICDHRPQELVDQLIRLLKKKDRKDMFLSVLINKIECPFQAELKDNAPYIRQINSLFGYFEDSLKTTHDSGVAGILISSYSNLGLVYQQKKQYDAALKYYTRANEILADHHFLSYYLSVTKNLSETYELIGNYKQSNEYLTSFTDSLDVMYADLLDKSFTEASAKYENLERDKKLIEKDLKIAKSDLVLKDERSSKNNILIFSLITILGIFIIAYLVFQRLRKKRKILSLQIQKEKEINAAKTLFLESIAHEVRTPISLVKGYLDLASEEQEKESENLGLAKKSVEDVISNTESILKFLKDEKENKPKLESIYLLDYFKRTFYAFESLAESKKIDLIFESFEENVQFVSDTLRLDKIINNLITNAIKYSNSKTQITLKVEVVEGLLSFSILDNGFGIPNSEKHHIFEKFYQVDESKRAGGVGLGLAITKKCVEDLSGNISVCDNLPSGSIFNVSIPIELTSLESSIDDSSNLISDFKILIVEDNPEMNKFLLKILSVNYSCVQAFNGIEALEKLQQSNFDLIISDIMMDQMDGMKLKEKINQSGRFDHIPFVFLSAKTGLKDRTRAFDLGAEDFILKPFNKNVLLLRVKNILNRKAIRAKWAVENKELALDPKNESSKLMKQLNIIVLEHLENENFNVAALSEQIGYSSKHIGRIIKKELGLTPVQFILETRLQKAHQFLCAKKFDTLSEIRFAIGISSTTYFNKKFRERFGESPKDMKDKIN